MITLKTIPAISALKSAKTTLERDWNISLTCAMQNPEHESHHLNTARAIKSVADLLQELIEAAEALKDAKEEEATVLGMPW